MLEYTFEWRLSADITGQSSAFCVESARYCDRLSFCPLHRWSQVQELLQSFAAATMYDTGGCADVFVGETGCILLQEIHQASFALKCGEQQQSGPVHAFRRQSSFRLRLRQLYEALVYFACKFGADENAPCQFHTIPKSDCGHTKTIALRNAGTQSKCSLRPPSPGEV